MLIHLAVALWFGTALLSLAAVAFVLVRLPEDYFLHPARRRIVGCGHPLWIVAKNALGVFLILAGLVLSIPGVPGQGLLTVLIGTLLVDFPGKYRFERLLLSRPAALGAADRLRQRFGRPPFRL
ncbi:MAG: hypothetical protein WC728_07675 [Elusimicrobiota bacterium]